MVRLMEVDDDVEVTVQALTHTEILEEIQGDTVVLEEDEEIGTAKDEVPVKSSNEEVLQASEKLLTYSIFTENWEIGAMATKIFSVSYLKVAYMCSFIYCISIRWYRE